MADYTILSSTIERLLDGRKYAVLRELLLTMKAADLAPLFEEVPDRALPLLFRLLSKDLAAETFVEMDGQMQEKLISDLSDSELKEIIDELYLDDTVDLVEELPAGIVTRILAQSGADMRQLINEMLKYPSDSAGSIMTTEYVDLSPDMTALAAIDHIRATGVDRETVNICYVTDLGRQLIGAISLRTLILSDENALIRDIMESHVISVSTLDDQEDVANSFTKYGYVALPAVDSEGRLVGIVTVDDAMDVLQKEVTEDIDKMAAITPSDRPYLKQSAFEIYKSRIPWLMLLMISATFTGSIITHFEGALSAYLVLAASIPMLMDTGGNCGSQASVTVIRALSLREMDFSDIGRVLWKETRVSVYCGLTLAAVNFVKLIALGHVAVSIAAVICISLACTVFFAKLVGCSLPMLAKRLGFDPAVMASPFITTIVDALSLFIYFQMAELILKL